MHVVYVTRELVPSLRCGGIGSYVWDMSRHVARRGHRATVVCASDDTRSFSDTIIQDVRVVRLPGGDFAIRDVEPAGRTPLTRYLRTATRYRSYRRNVAHCLDALVSGDAVDVVEFAEYGNEAAEWMSRPRRVPMVIRIHGPASRNGGRRVRWQPWRWLRHHRAFHEYDAVRSAQAVTCPSAAMAQLARSDGRLDHLPIEIIPNPVAYDAWANGEAHADSAFETAAPTIFTAGSVVSAKGIGELVEAVCLLRYRGRDVRLTIAGKWGKLGQSLNRRLREDRELSSWLTLLGHVPRERLGGYYRRAALVCFPSWWENCPCACLEAMASGGLVVGSSAGGMAEIITDRQDGCLVRPRDPVLLAGRLEEALEMPRAAKATMRSHAQRRIRTTFDVNVVVPRMLDYYQDVIHAWRESSELVRRRA